MTRPMTRHMSGCGGLELRPGRGCTRELGDALVQRVDLVLQMQAELDQRRGVPGPDGGPEPLRA